MWKDSQHFAALHGDSRDSVPRVLAAALMTTRLAGFDAGMDHHDPRLPPTTEAPKQSRNPARACALMRQPTEQNCFPCVTIEPLALTDPEGLGAVSAHRPATSRPRRGTKSADQPFRAGHGAACGLCWPSDTFQLRPPLKPEAAPRRCPPASACPSGPKQGQRPKRFGPALG